MIEANTWLGRRREGKTASIIWEKGLFLLSKSHFLSFIFFAQKPNLFNHHTLVTVVLKKKRKLLFCLNCSRLIRSSYDRMLILVFWCSLDNQAPVVLWFISLTKHITFVFHLIFKNKTKTRAQLATEINITYFWGKLPHWSHGNNGLVTRLQEVGLPGQEIVHPNGNPPPIPCVLCFR